MANKNSKYTVVYRGETLEYYSEGRRVFFQLPKESGSEYWFGRTFHDCFWLEFGHLTLLSVGIDYLLKYEGYQ